MGEFRKPEHLKKAIYCTQNWLSWIPLEDPHHSYLIVVLNSLQSMGFKDFSVGSIQGEHSCNSVLSGQPSFWDLIASLESPLKLTRDEHLLALTSASHMTDMAKIEKAIRPCQLLLASFHPSDVHKSFAAHILGNLLFCASKFTNDIEYLNKAILIL